MIRFSWIKFKRTSFKGKEPHLPPALKAPHTVHYGCSVFSKYLLMMISDICLPSHCLLMVIFKQPKLSMKISFWKGMKIPTFNILLKAFCNRPDWLRNTYRAEPRSILNTPWTDFCFHTPNFLISTQDQTFHEEFIVCNLV